MEISLEEPEWTIVNGIKIPLAGGAREDLKARRLLGPQGQSPEEWERQWRAGHTPHYKQLIIRLQNMDPEDRLTNIAAKSMLVGARLDREDLAGMDLRNMNLTNASFRGADLTRANLSGATLIKCDFSRACLHLVDASGACFDGSDMSMCYMKGALFERASMQRVWFRHAICDSALFFDVDLSYSNFSYGSFWGARFDDATMEEMHGLEVANFVRWLRPDPTSQTWAMTYREGWRECWQNPMGTTTFQVNAGRQ